MANNKRSGDTLNLVGAIIGLPFTLLILILWSPLLILAAVANLFSSEPQKHPTGCDQQGSQSSDTKRPSKLGFLLFAGVPFAIFVWFLSGGMSGGGASTSHPGGGYNPQAVYQPAAGAVWVNGYYRSDGTYVPGHYRTRPDGDSSNNWSTYPNVNPYTGQRGSRKGYGK